MANKKITTREADYSQWYLDVIEAAQLAENSIVRGCMVIKPYGYAIWEGIQRFMDKRIKETGHENLYFPIFIPKSLFSREAEHVEGFAKESAVVTHHRLKLDESTKQIVVDPEAKLGEELIVRPTSETIMYDTFSNWIKSWRDLPLLTNQWANIVRWEMRTRPFLRTAEFLWQEGHTAHATHDEADDEAIKMLGVYRELAEDVLAVPVITGTKSESEKFAGALRTYCIEAMMQDGKALQAGTSHHLGQNFAKAFDVKFADKDEEIKYVWQTSWGLSTRIIGALIMSHSDDKGLVLPSKIAPIQVVIVPIFKEENKKEVLSYAEKVFTQLKESDIRVKLDDRDYETPGSKFNEWEKKGVPVRLEIGPKDIENNAVMSVNRVTGEKKSISSTTVQEEIKLMLEKIQKDLFDNAKKRLESNIYDVTTWEEFKDVVENKGFARVFWDEDPVTEAKIKEETKATSRCLPFDTKEEEGKCIYSGKPAKRRWIFAQAY